MLLIVGVAAFLLLTVPGVRRIAGAFAQTLVQFVTGEPSETEGRRPRPWARGVGCGEG